jgi:hypothetical protein
MNSVRARLIGVSMIAALVFGGLAAQPAGAKVRTPEVKISFVGTYSVHVNWMIFGKAKFTMLLNADHTGAVDGAKSVKWKSQGNQVTITLKGGGRTATYLGTASTKGINTKAAPGTMSNNTGDSGTWYAVVAPPE